MKAQFISIVSAFLFFGMSSVLSQEIENKVQLRIIENGKVISDTTFSVNEKFGKDDIGKVSRIINNENVFVLRDCPYHRGFAYNTGNGDSVRTVMVRKFRRDTAVVFRDFADKSRIRLEKEIIMDGSPYNQVDDGIVVIRSENPSKKQIIIKDINGNLKTVRKKIDDETEIIIIKKDRKKIKPERHNSRKRERY